MNEIPELKDHLAFLKKFDSHSKTWKEFGLSKKDKKRTNFLLHPKRISSDSECTSSSSSPRKFYSGTMLKNSEPNNNEVEKETIELKKSATKTLTTNKVEKVKVRPESCNLGCQKKFKNLIERSLKVLANIKQLLEKEIPLPDGEEDYFRRVKRVQEFSARFSRMYLYPIMRQMDELSMADKLAPSIINQKFLHAQQIILQGLQAYNTHLPTSVGKCASDKLKSLLDQTIYMCHLYEMLKKDENLEIIEFINALKNYVEILLEAVTTFEMKFVEENPESKSSKAKTAKSKKPKSKLSMYLVNSAYKKTLELRKGIETLNKRNNVKSKYKTAGFKHRPPIEREQNNEETMSNRIKFYRKTSSGQLKSTPKHRVIREDDIKTMVEMDSEPEAPPNTGENVNHENSVASHRLAQDDNQEMINKELSTVKSDEINVGKALDIIKQYLGKNSTDNELLEKIVSEVDKKIDEKERKKLKKQVITVTGAKNAKLICIRDDNSVIEDVNKTDKEIMTDAELKFTTSETQTEMKRGISSKSAIKISRLPQYRKMLQLLPKEYAINIIQYKLRYIHFHKNNPMYRKSAQIQPWVLMGRISDEILDFVLKSVSTELEVNEILENLYNAEFQY